MGTVFLVTRTLINIDDRCWVSYRFVGSVLTMSLSRLFLCTHFASWVCLFAKWIISLIICHGLYIPAYRNRFSKNTHLEVFLCVCVCVIHMYVHKYIRTYIHYNIHTHTYIYVKRDCHEKRWRVSTHWRHTWQCCQRCMKTHDYMRAHCHTHEDTTLRTRAHTHTDVYAHKRTQIHIHARTHVCETDRELLVILLRSLAGVWLLKTATSTSPKCCCCTTSATSPRPDIMPDHI